MRKPKYKVGDMVRVLDYKKIVRYMPHATLPVFLSIGKTYHVIKVLPQGDDSRGMEGICYVLNFEDLPAYRWEDLPVYDERVLEPFPNGTIIIRRNGDEVIAYDKVTGQKAAVKCGTDGEFDFKASARTAFQQLMDMMEKSGKETKYYNGKVVYIGDCDDDGFEKGKIYECINGHFVNEDDDPIPQFITPIRSFDDLLRRASNNFIEIVEKKTEKTENDLMWMEIKL